MRVGSEASVLLGLLLCCFFFLPVTASALPTLGAPPGQPAASTSNTYYGSYAPYPAIDADTVLGGEAGLLLRPSGGMVTGWGGGGGGGGLGALPSGGSAGDNLGTSGGGGLGALPSGGSAGDNLGTSGGGGLGALPSGGSAGDNLGTDTFFLGTTSLTVAPVPEPATMLLLGTGLVGLAGLKRRFKK